MSAALRKVLLWGARNRWLGDRLPRLAFMRKAVRKYLPGDTADDALNVAVDLQVLGIGTVYERLGEDVTALAQAQQTVEAYTVLLAALKAAEIDGEISVKLTQLGLDVDEDACFTHLVTLAAAVATQGSYLWIDMEDSRYVDRTLELYQRLRATHPRTGVCLQAYLKRTAKDVERLLPINPAIRLVKGGYDEPKTIAFKSRREVDANFSTIAVTLLREGRARPLRIALGTPDVELIMQIASHAAAAGIPKDAFEIQMFYGTQSRDQRALARSGYRVQTHIAYGVAWYPWFMQRLAERPSNVLAALRQLLP